MNFHGVHGIADLSTRSAINEQIVNLPDAHGIVDLSAHSAISEQIRMPGAQSASVCDEAGHDKVPVTIDFFQAGGRGRELEVRQRGFSRR